MASKSLALQGVNPGKSTRSQRAIIRVTQQFLAEGNIDFRLQEVFKRAEVVPQTFYNHFGNRQTLLTAAVDAAMSEWEADMLQATSNIVDPLEQLATNMRLFVRMSQSHPGLAAVIIAGQSMAPTGRQGYTDEAFRQLSELQAQGLIKPLNLKLALMAVVAATERLMQLRTIDKKRPLSEIDELVFQNLVLLGVSPRKAKKLIERELPTFPAKTNS